jgi:REP element-mobilizing transposase RayT
MKRRCLRSKLGGITVGGWPSNWGQHEVSILKGHVSKDHVHLLISLPAQVTISRLMQWLKGKTAHHLMLEFPHLKKQLLGQTFVGTGVFLLQFRQCDG